MGSSVDVVIPIYKAGNDFASMLEKLYKQSKRPEHIYLLQTIEKKDEKLFDIKNMVKSVLKLKIYRLTDLSLCIKSQKS